MLPAQLGVFPRGYVYDNETRLYYLQSRYYDPELGRFINADAFASTGQGFVGNNMFAYCLNNPATQIDTSGELGVLFWAGVAAATISGISNAISVATNGGSVQECLVAGLVGVASGAIGFGIAAATGFSPWGNIAARAASSAVCNLGTSFVLNGEITGRDVVATAVDVTMDVCFSTVTYYYTDPISNIVANTIVNGAIDGATDITETVLFSQPKESSSSTQQSRTAQNKKGSIPKPFAPRWGGEAYVM